MKVLFINISDDGGRGSLGVKSVNSLKQKYSEEKGHEVNLLEIGEKVVRFLEDGSLDELAAIQYEIVDYAPDIIMLGVHGTLEDTNNCYFMPYGEEMRVLCSCDDLSNIFVHLTQNLEYSKLSLIMCYGARSSAYLYDHSRASINFKDSFAYHFLHNISKNLKSDLVMEAATGAVAVDDLTGELEVDCETEVYLDYTKDEITAPFRENKEKLQVYQEEYLLQHGTLKDYFRKKQYLLDDSPLGAGYRTQVIADSLALIMSNEIEKQSFNLTKQCGIIEFKSSSVHEISITRKYADPQCEKEKIENFRKQVINKLENQRELLEEEVYTEQSKQNPSSCNLL